MACKNFSSKEYKIYFLLGLVNGFAKDGWLLYSLSDNTQESGDAPHYMIMLLRGMFLDGAFN